MHQEPLLRYWGKAQAELAYHPFVYHSLDVMVVADEWLAASAVLRHRLLGASDSVRYRAWVGFFIALHDLGKLDVRFQAKAPKTLATLGIYPPGSWDRVITRFHHGIEGYRLASQELGDWLGLDDEDDIDDAWDAWQAWMGAVAGHHGEIPSYCDDQDSSISSVPPPLRRTDRTIRQVWVHALAKLFLYPAGLSLQEPPPPVPSMLAGFCAVCDWLGSNADDGYFPYTPPDQSLEDYLASRRPVAQRILQDAGLLRGCLPIGGMGVVFPERQPRQVQCVVEQLAAAPGLVLMEAPTGSGKTEAALAHASRLLAAGVAESIVFALPTQATANAMLERLERIAPVLFPGDHPNLVLAHGKARFNPQFLELRQAVQATTVQAEDEALVQCARWLAQSRKRSFLGQIGVCTVDQVLVSVLPVRHSFVRSFGVGRSVLIIDEVHAYDSYMYGLLGEVLRWQRQAGGSVVLLSATLPHHQRQRLVDCWDGDTLLEAQADYPLLTQLNAQGLQTFLVADAQQPPRREVAIELQESPGAYPDESVLSRLIHAAEAGARVVVIVNLVADAQRLTRELRGRTERPVDIFHSRYRFRDRQQREQEVLRLYDPTTASRGRILVATQVVEQSLDLDFDWMVTQLCPADLLFQRLGRLHRHELSRPAAYAQAQCLVLLPSEEDFALHGVIYGDLRALWRTRQRLQRASGVIGFPEAYREWIESVYDQGSWPDEPQAISDAADEYWAEQCAKRAAALGLVKTFRNPFNDDEQRVEAMTRDAEQSIALLMVLANQPAPTLLDGRKLADLGEWESAETLNLETLNVPERWQKWLAAELTDIGYVLALREVSAGVWVTETEQGELRYTQEFGLERPTDEANTVSFSEQRSIDESSK